MNKTKQFWTLFRFQMSINPMIFIMPAIFTLPLYLPQLSFSAVRSYHPDLEFLLLSNQNLFYVGVIGAMVLAPEIFQYGAMAAAWSSGTEFLLTRATDRWIVYRVRALFFMCLIAAIPVVLLLPAVKSSDLQIDEYNKVVHQEILQRMPGATAAPPDKRGRTTEITVPGGNLLVQAWRLWVILPLAIATQVLMLAIYPLKYRRFIFWVIYLALILLPLLPLFMHASSISKTEPLSTGEKFFFLFAAHQPVFWLGTALAAFLGQWWCERRFTQLEQ